MLTAQDANRPRGKDEGWDPRPSSNHKAERPEEQKGKAPDGGMQELHTWGQRQGCHLQDGSPESTRTSLIFKKHWSRSPPRKERKEPTREKSGETKVITKKREKRANEREKQVITEATFPSLCLPLLAGTEYYTTGALKLALWSNFNITTNITFSSEMTKRVKELKYFYLQICMFT